MPCVNIGLLASSTAEDKLRLTPSAMHRLVDLLVEDPPHLVAIDALSPDDDIGVSAAPAP